MAEPIIWCNQGLSKQQEEWIREAAGGGELILARETSDAEHLARAEIAFGQPPLSQVLESESIRWVQLSSAGYGSYDQAHARPVFEKRRLAVTKSSAVYAEPCAQHVLALMLAQSRQLPLALESQRGDRGWPQGPIRSTSKLLRGQSVLLVGYGSIGQRLVELLAPLTREITGVRRTPRGDEGIPMLAETDPGLIAALGKADHVVNLLPGIVETTGFFSRARLEALKPGAIFYNVGRGTTVDQLALAEQLQKGALAAAWLDVTDPEPLPPEHPLWTTPRCFITPHSAGGHHDEGDQLVLHFSRNLARYRAGEPLVDQVFPRAR